LQNAYRVGNQWAIFEGWTLAGSYLLAVASKHDLTNDAWTDSFGICEMGAERALIELCDECEQAMTLVQGDPFTDGHFYHVRITILVGLLSALRLYSHLKQPAERGPEFASQFLRTWRFKMKTWGESATPYFALAALASETAGEQAAAEAIALNTIRTVLEINGRRDGSPGLPSPYYSAEESLGFAYGTKERPRESFVGAAYTIHPLIDFLVRRWRRQALWSLWNPITGTTMQSFEPANDWDWFRWHTEEGVLNSRLLGSPQSWATLVREVGTVKIDSLPIRLRDRPRFALFFALVYPHRFTRELLRLIEISCGFGSS
jgi:hypothetical protein